MTASMPDKQARDLPEPLAPDQWLRQFRAEHPEVQIVAHGCWQALRETKRLSTTSRTCTQRISAVQRAYVIIGSRKGEPGLPATHRP
jgi:hypothetical protein